MGGLGIRRIQYYPIGLMHEGPVALYVARSERAWLGDFADQYVVGRWGGTGTDAEQGQLVLGGSVAE